MRIALRGEGPTDMGRADDNDGPMVIMIKKMDCFRKMIEECFGGIDDYIEWLYIHKTEIKNSKGARKKGILRSKKNLGLTVDEDFSKKRFFWDAAVFAEIAKEKEADMMIFFVDADKGGKNEYELRYESVVNGFTHSGVSDRAIPMIPNKISEAWLLCCVECENCDRYENLPTGDESNPRHPKKLIADMGKSPYQIAEECDPNCIDMSSFNRFRDGLSQMINNVCSYPLC